MNQTKSSKWVLSDKGWFAYNLLTSSQDRNQFLQQGDLTDSKISIITRVLAPPELFLYVKKAPILFIGWQIVFFLLFSFIATESEMVLFLVFFGELTEPNYFLTLGSIIVSWLIFSGITLVLSKQMLKRKSIHYEDILAISIFLGLSLLPLGLFPLLVSFSIVSLEQQFVPLAVVIILQLWVILLATRGISVQFFIRMERAGIIALIAVYMMMILGIIIGF
ncbi:MAG: hypothetical protein ACFFE5_14635 [Candidatus Thorarchaeota archaeon]